MAQLSATDTATDPCCAPEAQATCCEPNAKAACCGDSHADGCGCDAGSTRPGNVRDQLRERYAAAATQVATIDPGAGCCAPSETFDGGGDVFGAAYTGCIAGALTEREFSQALAEAGLDGIEIGERRSVGPRRFSR